MTFVANRASEPQRSALLIRIIDADPAVTRDPKCRIVHAWLRTLNVEKSDEDALWHELQRRLSILGALRQWVMKFASLKPVEDRLLKFWLESVDRAVAWWNREENQFPVSHPEVEKTGTAHPHAVLCTTVLQTLNNWIETQTIPHTVRTAINECTAASQKWCSDISLPPGASHAWNLQNYFRHSRRLAEVLPLLQAELEAWDDLVLEDVADELLRLAGSRSSMKISFSPARFTSDRDVILGVCRDSLAGWPCEIEVALATSQSLMATIPGSDTSLGQAFDPLRSHLRAFLAVLHEIQQSATEGESTAAFDLPEARPAAPDTDCTSDLVRVATWVSRASADVMPTIRNDLALLVEKSRNRTDLGGQSMIARDLLSLLVSIDSQLAVPIGPTRDLIELRHMLQRVLVDRFPYRVLDARTLIGRTFDEFRDQVRVRYSHQDGSGGRIVHVQRPGYIFQYADGRSTVIRPAEVDIST